VAALSAGRLDHPAGARPYSSGPRSISFAELAEGRSRGRGS